jgi:hypothetical protein
VLFHIIGVLELGMVNTTVYGLGAVALTPCQLAANGERVSGS